jgi:glutamate dehydrogenase (NAD(P)+)
VEEIYKFYDELGPLKVIHVHEPSVGLKAVLVVDNVARGPSIGGLRMAPDVSTEECFRLARAMTFKNAAAGIPHGGGKSVIYGDPKMPQEQKEKRIRTLARALAGEKHYIFGPDMGTNEECMAWVKDEINRSVGLPREIGGIPLDVIGATGFGIYHVIDVAMPFCDFDIDGARVAVQGFGAVGMNAARFLEEKGARLVAAADSQGTVHHRKGLDVAELIRLKEEGKSVVEFKGGKASDRDAIIGIECDIWIPAARPDVVNEKNVDQMKTRLVVQGANIPLTSGAEKYLYDRNVLCIPDFIANAGGVICAAMEYRGMSETATLQVIEEKLRRNTALVLEESAEKGIMPRQAAESLARRRLEKAMSLRRLNLF